VAEGTPTITAQESSDAAPTPPANRVLLVEDDDADALLVVELFADAGDTRAPLHVHTIAEALGHLDHTDCVLLDMNLPDASGLDGLRRLLEVEDHPAIVVLTGDVDETRGRGAVAAGAQDYLIKGRVDGQLLTRAVDYAVERRRAEHLTRQLHEARAHERENRRLGRGLLPTALLRDPALTLATRYQPGDRQLLLGGDFYDAIETGDGTIHAIIGDVSGHGPDEAAVGVSLRIAWRTLILAGVPAQHVLPVLDQVLVTERHDRSLFTTVAMVSIAPDRDRLALCLAGHPPPLLIDGTVPHALTDVGLGPPLGVRSGTTWPAVDIPLPREWSLLLYTDGLIEARDSLLEPLWIDGVLDLLGAELTAAPTMWRAQPDAALDALLAVVDRRAPLRGDDLALALLVHTPVTPVVDDVLDRFVGRYGPVPEAGVVVRRDLAAFLARHPVDPETAEDVVLVASELASNVVDHARTPFELTASLTATALRLDVTDGSTDPPILQPHDVNAVRGRGLQMVQAVASWTYRIDPDGKTITATIPLA